MRWTLPAVALALACLVPAAAAFTSLPHGDSPHDRITDDGARLSGWEGSTRALREAVRAPDLNEHEYDPQLDEPGRVDGAPSYSNAHHCGRDVGMSNETAFAESVAYIQEQRDRAVNEGRDGDASAAMAPLGRALHGLQDCYSHSDIVDFSADARTAYETLLVTGNGSMPEGLRLTGYDHGADEPGMPTGDAYPHDKYAKDDSDKNAESEMELADGRTKYQVARDLAINATAALLESVKKDIGEDAWADLQDVKADPIPKRFPIPAVGAPLALAAVAVAAALAAARGR